MKKHKKPKKKKKHVDDGTRKNIHEAVEKIPDMIAADMKKNKKKKDEMIESVFADKKSTNKHIVIPPGHDKKKRILWGSVGLITVVIFGMWILNMQTLFLQRGEAAIRGDSPTPWNTVGDDFDMAIESLKEEGNSDLDNALKQRKESEQTQEYVTTLLKNLIPSTTPEHTPIESTKSEN